MAGCSGALTEVLESLPDGVLVLNSAGRVEASTLNLPLCGACPRGRPYPAAMAACYA